MIVDGGPSGGGQVATVGADRLDLATSEPGGVDLRVALFDPDAQIRRPLPLEEGAKFPRPVVARLAVAKGDPRQLTVGDLDRVAIDQKPVEGRGEAGLVLAALAIEEQRPLDLTEEPHEALEVLRQGQVG